MYADKKYAVFLKKIIQGEAFVRLHPENMCIRLMLAARVSREPPFAHTFFLLEEFLDTP